MSGYWTDVIRQAMFGAWQQMIEAVDRNPVAWILYAALFLSLHINYQRGKDLDRVCALTAPHAVMTAHPETDRDEIANVCADR